MKTSKLFDRIDIIIDNGQQKKRLLSNSIDNNKDKNLELNLNNPFIFITTLFNKIISNTNSIDLNDVIKQWYNLYMRSKYTKIIRYKMIILTTCKFQEIYAKLLRSYNLLLLLKKIYISLLFDEFTYKLLLLFFWSKNEFFDVFKFWLLYIKAYRKKLKYLQIYCRRNLLILHSRVSTIKKTLLLTMHQYIYTKKTGQLNNIGKLQL